MKFDTIETAVAALARGELIVVMDDDDRECEGDLVMAAQHATREGVAFMIRHTSGILCTPLLSERAHRLHLDPMVVENDAPLGTAFTVSVDYKAGLTTGISAEERCNTVRALADANVSADEFVRPGHVFPLIAKDGGVLIRAGHTEATIDLLTLAGLERVGLLSELMNDDGLVKKGPDVVDFAKQHNLKVVSIDDLIALRQKQEKLVNRVRTMTMQTTIGPATAHVYKTPFDTMRHLALVFGQIDGSTPVLVRIHREDVPNDIFGDRRVLTKSLEYFSKAGNGVLIFLRDGAFGVQDVAWRGKSSAPASVAERREQKWRTVGVGAQILSDLNVQRICLLSPRTVQFVGLDGFGIKVDSVHLLDDAPSRSSKKAVA